MAAAIPLHRFHLADVFDLTLQPPMSLQSVPIFDLSLASRRCLRRMCACPSPMIRFRFPVSLYARNNSTRNVLLIFCHLLFGCHLVCCLWHRFYISWASSQSIFLLHQLLVFLYYTANSLLDTFKFIMNLKTFVLISCFY